LVGNIGTPQLMNYTAIGDAVNLAKRLEETSSPGQILLSTTTREMVDLAEMKMDESRFVSLGRKTLKGANLPMEVFHIVLDDNNS